MKYYTRFPLHGLDLGNLPLGENNAGLGADNWKTGRRDVISGWVQKGRAQWCRRLRVLLGWWSVWNVRLGTGRPEFKSLLPVLEAQPPAQGHAHCNLLFKAVVRENTGRGKDSPVCHVLEEGCVSITNQCILKCTHTKISCYMTRPEDN